MVQHHKRVLVHILPLDFSVVLQCKGEVVHSWLSQGCMVVEWRSGAVHTAVGGSMGSLVGKKVVPDRGTVGCSVVHVL